MAEKTVVHSTFTSSASLGTRKGDPCVMIIFGASGDLTKRLLMPALFNLACDGLLPDRFAIIGMAMDNLATESFREKMSKDIREFGTRKPFAAASWDPFVSKLHYTPGKFDDPQAYRRLSELTAKLDGEIQAGGNILFYMATPPVVFGMISSNLEKSGFKQLGAGWKRIIVEKPFGHDLQSAQELNREILSFWKEEQIYRIDHYLGKETVQNLLAFRFSNGIFEPLWNRNYVDHIQFTVAEKVGVEGRGNYYDRSGVLRDMIQNHMFQMLAYLCMEPPASFKSDAIRNEKAKLLDAVRVMTHEEVHQNTVRGQYGRGRKPDGSPAPGYREERDVNPQSNTETFGALKLTIDNWRWAGVPIYLRSGKSLWKKDTEIVVQFKKAPEVIFQGTPARDHLEANQLIFHIQPDEGIELRFLAKIPGMAMNLQKVNMRFTYGEAFQAAKGTGYEVMIYNCMIGDATLFSRTDLVETAWRIAQPMLDVWAATPAADFPNYPVGTWGPKAAFELIERDGRQWVEVINHDVLEKVPLFQNCDTVFLNTLVMMLKPARYGPGDFIIKKGEKGSEMYVINRGEVEVLDGKGKVLSNLSDGNFFGEIGLLLSTERTASIRAISDCDLFMLEKADFTKALREYPQFSKSILDTAKSRYNVALEASQLLG
ncbi:MAG: glucose-6-phosphate dehydrogenase [Planctomycetes bacterium]|nr:glucose-6-phosphate dehydrogenase [Planctomycetota bacterium]